MVRKPVHLASVLSWHAQVPSPGLTELRSTAHFLDDLVQKTAELTQDGTLYRLLMVTSQQRKNP